MYRAWLLAFGDQSTRVADELKWGTTHVLAGMVFNTRRDIVLIKDPNENILDVKVSQERETAHFFLTHLKTVL
ncbi:MAG: hypothetical protein B7O98_08865 [Zestosphaera tikiterensis]|uniref:Uncharacterized protein n=1 Tax=Zestosphaera tikiterensis TaxID=1973259 RepID=A0A2R7Y2C2_9CREN|nr:MAG: hypothetical protein B7O98_08695 [Zestosphaera tikiterensis]PUA31724.1 MAG: hypothetical protein B7O98_08865 [Zestosphaera tikiterensis]